LKNNTEAQEHRRLSAPALKEKDDLVDSEAAQKKLDLHDRDLFKAPYVPDWLEGQIVIESK
jgi:hypothetical protein